MVRGEVGVKGWEVWKGFPLALLAATWAAFVTHPSAAQSQSISNTLSRLHSRRRFCGHLRRGSLSFDRSPICVQLSSSSPVPRWVTIAGSKPSTL